MQTAALVFLNPVVNPVSGNWLPDSDVAAGTMVKGIHWDTMKAAVLAMPGSNPSEIVEGTNSSGYSTVQYKGATLYNFLGCHDLALLGHAPPLSVVNKIRNASNGRTKVGLYFANFETVAQQTSLNPWWTTLENVCLANLRNTGVAQTGLPGSLAGCTYADQYEGTAVPTQAPCGTQAASKDPHDWVCDMKTNPGNYALTWFAALINMVLSRYTFGGIDYILVDNVLGNPYWGSPPSSNQDATVTQAIYQAAWKTFWQIEPQFFAQAGTKMIGNCAIASTAYSSSDVPRRYGEHFLHAGQTSNSSTSESGQNIIDRIHQNRFLDIAILSHQIKSVAAVYNARSYASNSVDAWSGTDGGPGGLSGDWRAIRDAVYADDLGTKFYAMITRTGTDFPSYWQPLFKAPV